MDILGALKKLIGVGQHQQAPQAAPVAQHMPQAVPFPSHPNMKVGVIDKPTTKPLQPFMTSELRNLIPQNKPNPLYRVYTNPETGAQTLENDNAEPNDPNAVHPFKPIQAPVDSPHQLNGFNTLIQGTAVPQYQRRLQRGDRVRSI